MAKKDFTAEAADIFVTKITQQPTAAMPSPIVDIRKALQPEEVKITFMLNAELNDKLRYIGIKEHKKLKQIIGEALQDYAAAWQRKNGEIK